MKGWKERDEGIEGERERYGRDGRRKKKGWKMEAKETIETVMMHPV